MTRLQKIEQDILALSPSERADLRRWFQEIDAANWDREFEIDVAAGKLDDMAAAALEAHRKGKTTLL